jgi:uncharacterized protein (UPF0332 family)
VKPSDALAQHRLERARTALHEADILIEQRQFTGAMNRLYYAAFYGLAGSLPRAALIRPGTAA